MKYNDDIIDLFIQKKLPAEEIRMLEAEMARDSLLSERVTERREFLLFARLLGQRVRKKEIEKIMAEGNVDDVNSERGKRKKMTPLVYVAVVVFSLIIALALCWNLFYTPAVVPIAENIKNEIPSISIQRASPSENLSPQEKAEQFYMDGAYMEMLNAIKDLPGGNSKNQLMSGGAYHALGKYGEAIEQYHLIIINENSPYVDDAKWYAARTYLKSNDKPKAIDLLNELKTETAYSDEAGELLRELQ